MQILFLHTNKPDYLADSLFHGLRTLLGAGCVDVPRYDSLYWPLTDESQRKLRGNGFTLYGLLEEAHGLDEKRSCWHDEVNAYDLIIIANIWAMWPAAKKLLAMMSPERLAFLDGSDSFACFPYGRNHLRDLLLMPNSLRHVRYFKRELAEEGARAGKLSRWMPKNFWMHVAPQVMVSETAFSIPQEKIWRLGGPRSQEFTTEIVDAEAAHYLNADQVGVGRQKYSYHTEEDYYADLRRSRFGITTKRAGWDCLRHYEFAANGCVLCFRDLDSKPPRCAPHGLDDSNCIIYHDAEELMRRTSSMTEQLYRKMQASSYAWVEQNTTLARARKFLNACGLPASSQAS